MPAQAELYPLFFKLSGRTCVVVGGGTVAERKVAALLKAGARIKVLSPELTPSLLYLAENRSLEWVEARFSPPYLDGATLVIAATDDASTNQRVYQACEARGIPVNVVDHPSLCSFFSAATVKRGLLQIAISTSGKAPILARLIRARIECLLPRSLEELLATSASIREEIKRACPDADARRAFWEDALGDSIHAKPSRARQGHVSLVGAGPGDPDLLTIKAMRLLQECDAIVYDRLVSPEILDLARRDARRYFVGKESGAHSCSQAEIHHLLVRLAQEGNRVVRLKGGDPFVFGRGGEEIEALQEAGIAYDVVPGITAAIGCAAYAGIPLTHRNVSQSIVFITAHAAAGASLKLDWKGLARPNQTLVAYMGLAQFEAIRRNLLESGMSSSTPVAIVAHGTMKNQRVITGTLKDPPSADSEKLTSPALLIIGDVVSLRRERGQCETESRSGKTAWWVQGNYATG